MLYGNLLPLPAAFKKAREWQTQPKSGETQEAATARAVRNAAAIRRLAERTREREQGE